MSVRSSNKNRNIDKDRIKTRNITLRRRFGIYYGRLIFVLKFIIIIFALAFIFTDLFKECKLWISDKFYSKTAEIGFVLKDVVIQGQINTPSKEIIEAIGASKGVPIFSISIDDIQQALESSPWVKSCIVERRLPDTIYVALFERTPIAIWQFNQKLYLIDEEGERISSKRIKQFSELIHVVGEGADIYAKGLIEDLSIFPDLASRVHTAIRYGNRRWDIILDDSGEEILVKMPEEGFDRAYKYLQKFNKENKLFGNHIKSFDLRLPDRYFYETRVD